MLRCAGVKRLGAVCSDVLCDSRHWNLTAYYRGDLLCHLCGKQSLEVLCCDVCGAVDKHDGYGRYAEKEGAACGRLYEDDADADTEVLAADSDDDEATIDMRYASVCVLCEQNVEANEQHQWLPKGLAHRSCPRKRSLYDCCLRCGQRITAMTGSNYRWLSGGIEHKLCPQDSPLVKSPPLSR